MDCDLNADLSCCPEWEGADPAKTQLALTMAQGTLRTLTGYRTANCPVTVRPCSQGCASFPTWMTWPVRARDGSWAGGGPMSPTVVDGQWFNIVCGCGRQGCSCTQVCEIRLPGEVASVESVILDGATLDPGAYRVDNPGSLVRTDGQCWPLCQDMNAGLDQPGTFAVTFTPGVPLGAWGASAYGTLACEFLRAMCGDKRCKLPANATQVARAGVTVDLTANPFPNGLTGLREVDAFIRTVNPNSLRGPSLVWSPDVRYGRSVR